MEVNSSVSRRMSASQDVPETQAKKASSIEGVAGSRRLFSWYNLISFRGIFSLASLIITFTPSVPKWWYSGIHLGSDFKVELSLAFLQIFIIKTIVEFQKRLISNLISFEKRNLIG